MPVLKIQTNQPIDGATRIALLEEASNAIADELGKPEYYVMVIIEHTTGMMFSGNTTPLAYLELKSIGGLQPPRATSLSKILCYILRKTLGIPSERVYIEFTEVHGKMWGWNSSTF